MLELQLLGLHSDGSHLVLTAEDGSRYTLAIDDALRVAVRKDRPHLEAIHAANSSLSVKDIQALIRAGSSIEEIALTYDMSLDRLRKYERPIIAEKAWAAERALSCRINGDANAPKLGDTVVDRLAARGVDPNYMNWTAVKKNDEPWEIILTFAQGATERQARWSMEENGQGIFAIDEEAHWLTETAMPPSVPQIVVPIVDDEQLSPEETQQSLDKTQAILDELSAVRGTRQSADIQQMSDTIPIPLKTSDIADIAGQFDGDKYSRENAESSVEDSANSNVTEIFTKQDSLDIQTPEQEVIKPIIKPKTTKRQSVPTWDEIVFGGKTK